jgi:hypothetical protein
VTDGLSRDHSPTREPRKLLDRSRHDRGFLVIALHSAITHTSDSR